MMAAPVLTRSLNALRAAFNLRFPRRDHASDGWIGDTAHQQSTSGHNADDTPGVKAEYSDADSKPEVRAIDVDADLRDSVITMLKVIQAILANPAALKRLRYIIFNGVIWSRTTGWQPRAYTGSNKHDKHAHFSGDPADDENADAWTVVLNIGKGTDVATTPADAKLIKDTLLAHVLNPSAPDPADRVTVGQALLDAHRLYNGEGPGMQRAWAANERVNGLLELTDVQSVWSNRTPDVVQVNVLRQALEQIHGAVVAPAPVDPAALQSAVAAVVTRPEFLASLASAINADAARRLAD